MYEAGQQTDYDAKGDADMEIGKGLVGGEDAMHISAVIMDVVETPTLQRGHLHSDPHVTRGSAKQKLWAIRIECLFHQSLMRTFRGDQVAGSSVAVRINH